MGAMRSAAVIGSGVAGLTAAYALQRGGTAVTLYEADDRLGGHAHTHDVDGLRIDTGFIVHNERTYPILRRLFAELDVPTRDSEMSLSVSDEESGREWAGALGLRGLFPDRASRAPRHARMLAELPRFHRRARALLARPVDGRRSEGGDDGGQTLGEFLAAGGFSTDFQRHVMEPLVAAVWSCDAATARDYPARYLFAFLDHHGMLSVFGSPTWRTVVGGSRVYVDRVAATLDEVRRSTRVVRVAEVADGIEIETAEGARHRHDAVVVATHPGQALAMLAHPSPAQREVLSAMPYAAKKALLHTDSSLLPRSTNAHAAWNFRRPDTGDELVVTYDLTRLQGLATTTTYLLTLGGSQLVDPATVVDAMEYEHPLYTPQSVAAQARLPQIGTDRVRFAGAYHGWGFHEDGARSGLAAAHSLGATWARDVVDPAHRATTTDSSASTAAARHSRRTRASDESAEPPPVPALCEVTIRHTRRTPLRHSFVHRSSTWLVDLDHLPDHGPLARFEARDHLGDPARTIRQNLDTFLADRGVDLHGGRILMLANPRVLGYCFNPISVHWCYAAGEQAPSTVVLEVHNTYGDRHAYLVHPDAHGRATTEKRLYVSPFNDVSGSYAVTARPPGPHLLVAIELGDFSASLSGTTRPATRREIARAAVRHPVAPLVNSARIRWHGVRLWARRLPVRPRPTHHQRGVQ